MAESGIRKMSINVMRRIKEWLLVVEIRGYFLSASILFLSLITAAIPARAEKRAITLDDAYRMAFANHERVKIAGEELLQARKYPLISTTKNKGMALSG